jgi:hypothetical protein
MSRARPFFSRAVTRTLLERSAPGLRGQWPEYIPLRDPAWDPVRHSARFAALLRQANLDGRLFTSPRVRR